MRLRTVDIAAWLVIVASGIVLPVSALAALMLLAGSDGSASAGLVDTFFMVVAPPLAFMSGIGVLRRNRIAWLVLIVLLVLTALHFAWAWATANPGTTRELTASGVLVTTIGSNPSSNLPPLAACLLLLVPLLTRRAREVFLAPHATAPTLEGRAQADAARGWRVGHRGRDAMYYEELHAGTWQRIEIGGEMLTGRAHHVVYLASPEGWQQYPGWAQGRRDEIIARIRSEFRPPDYEYADEWAQGAGTPHTPTTTPAPTAAAPARQAAPAVNVAKSPRAATQQGMPALYLVMALMVGTAGGAGWLVVDGVRTAEAWFPGARPSHSRVVTRADEPVSYWLSLGLFSLVAGAAVAGTVWLVRNAPRTGGD